MAMLWANGIAATACAPAGAHNGRESAWQIEHFVMQASCIDHSLVDSDSMQGFLQVPELVDCGMPLRVCNTSPVQLLPSHSSARTSGTSLTRGCSDLKRRGLATVQVTRFSAYISFPLRFFASERVVVLKRINC